MIVEYRYSDGEYAKYLFSHAKVAALASPGVGLGKFRHGAILVQRGKTKILSAAYNQLKTHPKLAKKTNWPYLHAETSAMIKYGLDRCNNERIDLVVVRLGKIGDLRLSKPCKVCEEFMNMYSIGVVRYSINETFYGVL